MHVARISIIRRAKTLHIQLVALLCLLITANAMTLLTRKRNRIKK
jgi:hypothetical protein